MVAQSGAVSTGTARPTVHKVAVMIRADIGLVALVFDRRDMDWSEWDEVAPTRQQISQGSFNERAEFRVHTVVTPLSAEGRVKISRNGNRCLLHTTDPIIPAAAHSSHHSTCS